MRVKQASEWQWGRETAKERVGDQEREREREEEEKKGYCENEGKGVKILDETVCISHRTNSLGKGMNPNIVPPAMGE